MTTAPEPRRWPRTQKFALSAEGGEAEAEYRSCIVASREEAGRASYDAARSEWATKFSYVILEEPAIPTWRAASPAATG